MYLSVTTVLNQYALAGAIIRVFIGPGTLTTFQHHGIIVHMHETAVDEHIGTGIDVDGIR